ncbi:MAG: T9SS type A sorting domain-containing protein [Bacteroidota bacterium]
MNTTRGEGMITALHVSDSTIWTYKPDSEAEVLKIYDLIIDTTEHALYALWYEHMVCDVGGERYFLQKIDYNGKVKWETELQKGLLNGKLTLDASGNILGVGGFSTSMNYYKVSPTGTIELYSMLTGVEGGNSITTDTAGNAIVSGDNQIYMLAAGTPIYVRSHPLKFTGINRVNDQLIITSTRALYRLNYSLDLIDSLPLNSFSGTVQSCGTWSSGFWVSAQTDTNSKTLTLLAPDYTVIRELVVDKNQDFSIKQIDAIGTIVLAFGDKQTFDGQKIASAMTIGPNSAQRQTRTDLALIGITTSNVSVQQQSGYYYINYSVTAKVRNDGPDTIRSFDVNAKFYSSWVICYEPVFHAKVYGVIPPGAEFEVYVGETTNQRFGTASSTVTYNYCFWTSSPNQLIDVNPGNDKFCGQSKYLGVEEQAGGSAISIAPNPAHDSFTLFSREQNSYNYTMLDNTGKTIRTGTALSGQSIPLDRVAPGFYFLKITDQQGKPGTLPFIVN